MSISFLPKLAMAAAALLPPLAAFQAKDPAKEPTKASISGVVVDALQGKPVKEVKLLLVRSNGTGTPSASKSGEDGAFEFKDLEAGSYVLVAEHARYARQSYGSRAGLMGGTPLTVVEGQALREISFKLQPNAIASGRVLDEDGEPVQNVMVAALKSFYQRGRRQYMPLGTAMTNDLGEFRLANLAAGRYLISATVMRPGTPPKPAGDQPEQSYVPTYYPNSSDASAAAPVEVRAGADVAGLDIKLVKTRSVRVKGKVAGAPKDQPVTVRLVQKGAGILAMFTSPNARVSADGSFEIAGITPGSYTLRAGDPTGMKPLGAGLPVEVADRSIENLILEIQANPELAGVLRVEGDEKPVLKGARIMLEAAAGMSGMPPNTTVNEDGTFTLKNLSPESYFVRVLNGPANCYVSAARVDDRRMEDQGIELGTPGSGKLEIVLRAGGAQVEGVVNGADDKPLGGVTVALIPNSKSYLLYQASLTDQKGAFSFKGVTPGDYKILAWEEVEPNAFQDPEFVKPFESRAENLSLKENDRKAMTIKAVARQ